MLNRAAETALRLAVLALLLIAVLLVTGFLTIPRQTAPTQTVYIRNLARPYISDKTIRNDIPAWEDAVNKDLAPVWHTTQFRYVFIGRAQAPKGAMTALFISKGPVKGALAYHTVANGVPQIVVYAGTGSYYGYDNSVSFTHEAEELAVDPTTSVANQGWPYDWVWFGQEHRQPQSEGNMWIQEVSDPVESFSYARKGADGTAVQISDFITPNWFNDEVKGDYDFMQLVQQPFTILRGGYAQFWDGLSWNSLTYFRGAGRDAAGFLKAEAPGRS